MTPAAENENGKREAGYVQAMLQRILENQRDMDEKLDRLLDWKSSIESRVARLEERQGIMAALQAVYATVAAVVAGYFGSRP